MRIEILERISEIDAREWNRLAGNAWPFLKHEFLHAAEAGGCVSEATGWQPRHLVLRSAQGSAVAVMPLYEKSHSWGEFVFDWAWAQAYHRAGVEYYPKLVSTVPFTPAPSPRLLSSTGVEGASTLIAAALELARESGHSSLHILFPDAGELGTLREAGLELRKDCQFHWHNRNYASFDEFLATFSSAKRKKARRDRRRVREQGIRFRWLSGGELDHAVWSDVYALISTTFLRRASLPYFDRDFFVELSERLPESILVVLAERRRAPVAAAVFYVGADTLYGRYWGSDAHYNALHFETCYYQGIDYCIAKRLSRFEPGTQGEHKVSRGFTPVGTWSAHWLARPEFFSAIGRYIDEERRYVERYMSAVHSHSPYRAGSRTEERPPGDAQHFK
ncbi:MAG TPA: GNAT family N-acetyltransferase [Woeseiaceae bacterium]|nr:GNAT family N-acetyltransferase [Woeseiaceae bacterium]